jgi:FKBP-type peptidyl-prolyl cis-trans isomerase FkpA
MEDTMKKSFIPHILIVFAIILTGTVFAQGIVENKSGLAYEDLVIGQGKKATPGKIASIHLKVWTNENGSKRSQLYDSHEENIPLSFKIGTKKITDGLNLGVNGMKEGGKRRLFVPPELNPDTASGKFPGNANLIYEVELLEVK